MQLAVPSENNMHGIQNGPMGLGLSRWLGTTAECCQFGPAKKSLKVKAFRDAHAAANQPDWNIGWNKTSIKYGSLPFMSSPQDKLSRRNVYQVGR